MTTLRAVGYARVSTARQSDDGYSLDAQRGIISAECERRGLTLVGVESDAASGKSTKSRAGLARALSALSAGDAKVLVVAKLDRLARSVIDFATIMARAERERWNLIILDLGIDLNSPNGRMIAGVVAVLAQWEREIISERIKVGLAEAAAQGTVVGRPSTLSDVVVARIVSESAGGRGVSAIARLLNAESVPTARGGRKWYPATVRQVLNGRQARGLTTGE